MTVQACLLDVYETAVSCDVSMRAAQVMRRHGVRAAAPGIMVVRSLDEAVDLL